MPCGLHASGRFRSSRADRVSLAPAAWRVALCALGALCGLGALGASGCGYGQDVPRLPAGAHSLAVRSVANLTDVGELDVRLRGQLLRRLEQNAHLQVLPPERSSLALDVELTSLTITRSLDPTLTRERSFRFTLDGRMTVIDLRTQRRVIDGDSVRARISRLYDPALRETPALRDEGLNDVLDAFAEQVVRRLFLTF